MTKECAALRNVTATQLFEDGRLAVRPVVDRPFVRAAFFALAERLADVRFRAADLACFDNA